MPILLFKRASLSSQLQDLRFIQPSNALNVMQSLCLSILALGMLGPTMASKALRVKKKTSTNVKCNLYNLIDISSWLGLLRKGLQRQPKLPPPYHQLTHFLEGLGKDSTYYLQLQILIYIRLLQSISGPSKSASEQEGSSTNPLTIRERYVIRILLYQNH